MNYIEKIQQLINKESKKVKKEGNKKSIELIVDISSDSDFENTLVHDVKVKQQRPVKRIINNHVKKNVDEKKKIDLKIVRSKLITMKRKRKYVRKPFIKQCDDIIIDSDEDIIKKSLIFKSFSDKKKKVVLDSIKLFNGILFSSLKRKYIVHYQSGKRYIGNLERDHLNMMLNRIIFDSVIKKERMKQLEEMARRMIYWMDRSEVAERKLQEMKQLKKLKVIIN